MIRRYSILVVASVVCLTSVSRTTTVEATASSFRTPFLLKNNKKVQSISTILSLRGGAKLTNLNNKIIKVNKNIATTKTHTKIVKQQQKPQSPQEEQERASGSPSSSLIPQKYGTTIITVVGSSIIAAIVWKYRSIIFNKQQLQSKTLDVLHLLNKQPKYKSYSIYIIGMSLWECIGLSTIPVETAAGMVFGWPDGFYLNGIGKLMGACMAFAIGRYSTVANSITDKSTFLRLVRSSTESNPWLVSFLMKFSCLPETIKNVGCGILKPHIKWYMFISCTVVHGWMFSALWTYLGVDTILRIEDLDGSIAPNRILQLLLSLALVNGIIVSPLSMVYWVRSLKQANDVQQENTKKKRSSKK
jgi:uncharacterized membrane protein YdjX (TVP38/TMEM64 family)